MGMSYSRVSTFRRCKQSHYFGYIEKLRPKTISRPLSFGGDFHRLMEGYYDPNKAAPFDIYLEMKQTYYTATQAQQDALGETYLEDLKNIYEDYVAFRETPSDRRLIGTEIRFEIPLPVSINGEQQVFTGVIDKLEEDPDGGLIITDYKTFTRSPDADSLVMNTQASLYAKAVQTLYGQLPVKMVWDYIKSKPADEPTFLEKSQRLSRAFGDKVTLESWKRACERYDLEVELTDLEAETLKRNRETYFKLIEAEVIPQMVDRVWKDFIKTVREIKYYSKSQTMSITRDCSWCDYQPLCIATLTGADVEYIKEKDFQKGE